MAKKAKRKKTSTAKKAKKVAKRVWHKVSASFGRAHSGVRPPPKKRGGKKK